jgi:hypothetical protein
MNKPLLAAVAGVSFGLFLGGLSFYGLGARTCQRRATVDHVPLTRVVVQKTVVAHPCPSMQDEPQADSAPTLDRSDPDSVLSYAQTLYVNGDYAQAISVAKSVESKSRVRAARIIGSAACGRGVPQAGCARAPVHGLCLSASGCDDKRSSLPSRQRRIATSWQARQRAPGARRAATAGGPDSRRHRYRQRSA